MYPLIIHQIWLQGVDKIPEKYNTNINLLKKFHPSWKYIIWDENLIKKELSKNLKWLKTYNNLQLLHQKVDYARYVILYVYGGVYIDMDVVTIKALDSLYEKYPKYDVILSKLNSNMIESYLTCGYKECINNGIIISVPNAPFILQLVDGVENNYSCKSNETNISCINRTTGPKYVTELYNSKDTDKNKIKVLHFSYLEPCFADYCDVKPNTYMVHTHDISWFPKWLKFIVSIYAIIRHHIYAILGIILLIIVIYFIKKNDLKKEILY